VLMPDQGDAFHITVVEGAGPLSRRHRDAHPYAVTNNLALRHQDIAKAVAANLPRPHGPPQGRLGADRHGGHHPGGPQLWQR